MVSCLFVVADSRLREKTKNPNVMASISIGAILLSHIGIRDCSTKMGSQKRGDFTILSDCGTYINILAALDTEVRIVLSNWI